LIVEFGCDHVQDFNGQLWQRCSGLRITDVVMLLEGMLLEAVLLKLVLRV
jgi:hypothetical protein